MSWTVAADVGGTFTDVILANSDGRYYTAKVLSSPPHFEISALAGIGAVLAKAGLSPTDLSTVLHGTTVATNSVLERDGRPAALVTTEGFVDVLEIGRLRIPNSYDLNWRKPEPLAPRQFRVAVHERVLADGSVSAALDPNEVVEKLRALVPGVDAVAISFINAYLNDTHEHAAQDAIAQAFPDLAVTCAADLVREIGEVERTSTAVLNAYLMPVMSRYLGDLVQGLAALGIDAAPLILQSSGGMMPVAEAASRPAAVLESGPAAGVVAAAEVVTALGETRAVGFDMGGTTAKASLIEDGSPLLASSFTVGSDVSVMGRLTRSGGYPVQLPSIDLAEVGAGGSSLVVVDPAGGIRVGPESAGADPGPVCYGRSGRQVTVTDADLLLGIISAEGLAHNGIYADVAAATAAMQEQIADPLGLNVQAAAFAVHESANFQMARALRAVTTERGRDLSDYVLVAFGGSGPVHAATLADSVGIKSVLIPLNAGLLSAKGLVHSPVQISISETVLETLNSLAADTLGRRLDTLRQRLVRRFADAGWDTSEARALHAVDARYQGQSSDLRIELGSERPAPDEIQAAFTDLHKSTYGYSSQSSIEIVRMHVTVIAAEAQSTTLRPAVIDVLSEVRTRELYVDGMAVQAPVVRRDELSEVIQGPCVVDESDTSTFVPADWTIVRDRLGNLRMERQISS